MKEERITPTVEEQQVLPVAVLDPWMQPIVAYLADGVLPEGRTEAAKLVRISSVYSLIEGALYRNSVTHPWSKCISLEEGSYILREIHEGECGAHVGAVTLYRKAMLQGFYWPTMKKDAEEMVKKCDKFHPWPFMIWGVDILGPFVPARGQVKFIVVAVDHFTKWIESKAKQNHTLTCHRFGTPHALVTDNGKQFDCASFRDFCTGLGILLKFSSVAHPQTNELTEVTNCTILSGIKKRLGDLKGRLIDELYHVVLDEDHNEESLRLCLDLLEERRQQVVVRAEAYRRQMTKYHNARVKERKFEEGDLVLKKAEIGRGAAGVGKLEANWDGPYRVVAVVGKGAYKIAHLDETPLPRTWNVENLKLYLQ
ncbi:uncharacterized protein LOC126661669 [Mercurialis annua]|uniref:uncharacterized protein LOC126661669 n=1 Tax=Mercurialis annua TaxID=3986 RepID=UPI00215EFAD8|nr:uncharacterized protein LOC126661669 [Mercurialis annua]